MDWIMICGELRGFGVRFSEFTGLGFIFELETS
jgi:hypothetical protein